MPLRLAMSFRRSRGGARLGLPRRAASPFLLPALLGALIIAMPSALSAQDMTWVNAGGGFWYTPDNWSPTGVPEVPGESATIGTAGTYTVVMDGSATVDRVWVTNPLATLDLQGAHLTTLLSGGLTNAGTLRSVSGWVTGDLNNLPGARITLDGGQYLLSVVNHVANDGLIEVNANGSNTTAAFSVNQNVTLDGNGLLRMKTAGSVDHALIAAYSWGVLHHQGNHTIRGAGRILAALVNDAAIVADVPGQTLALTDEAKTNNAHLAAVNGATLDMASPLTQGADGEILADGGTVLIHHNVTGGRFTVRNGGEMRVMGHPWLQNFALSGALLVPAGEYTVIQVGGVTNDGTIAVNPLGQVDNSALSLNQNVYFTGNGDIKLKSGGDPDDAQITAYGWGVLHNEAPHQVHGSGRILLPVVNNSTIVADDPDARLTLTDDVKTNNGLMVARSGGRLDLLTTLNQGESGELIADGGTVQIHANVVGGTLICRNGGTMTCYDHPWLQSLRLYGPLDIAAGHYAVLQAATIANQGVITVNPEASGDNTALTLNQNVHLTGPGTLQLRSAGDMDDAQITAYGWGVLHNEAPHQLRGAGRVVAALVNNSTLSADATGQALWLTDDGKTNNAVMRATNGGTLEVAATVTQDAAGQLLADAGTVRLRGSVIGGHLATQNEGVVTVVAGTRLTSITNDGRLDIPAGQYALLFGPTFVNNGVTTVHSDAGAPAALSVNGAVTLSGAGALALRGDGTPDNALLNAYAWGYVTNAAPHTIRGEGKIDLGLANYGTVAADLAGRTLALVNDPKYNEGTLRADGGTLQVNCAMDNQGVAEALNGGHLRFAPKPANHAGTTLTGGAWRVYAGSTLRLVGAPVTTVAAEVLLDGPGSDFLSDDGTTSALTDWNALTAEGTLEIRNGRLLGTSGALTNDGILAIGAGSTLTTAGAYAQSAAARLRVTLDATDEGGPGRLQVAGPATLSGRLRVELGGYQPGPGDTLTVLAAASRSGQFSTFTCSDNTLSLELIYTPTRVLLLSHGPVSAVEPPTPGMELPREARLATRALPGGAQELELALPWPVTVRLDLFDVTGRLVRTLADAEALPAGRTGFGWDGRDAAGRALPNGLYFARALVAGAAGEVVLGARVVRIR